jgi:hypothetical protein
MCTTIKKKKESTDHEVFDNSMLGGMFSLSNYGVLLKLYYNK